jgi:hypothetical protein
VESPATQCDCEEDGDQDQTKEDMTMTVQRLSFGNLYQENSPWLGWIHGAQVLWVYNEKMSEQTYLPEFFKYGFIDARLLEIDPSVLEDFRDDLLIHDTDLSI